MGRALGVGALAAWDGVPPFPGYFSGARVVYPPWGRWLTLGGLAGARLLSLVFMLGATALLWAAAGLFGRRAAFFAAALFAVPGLCTGVVRDL